MPVNYTIPNVYAADGLCSHCGGVGCQFCRKVTCPKCSGIWSGDPDAGCPFCLGTMRGFQSELSQGTHAHLPSTEHRAFAGERPAPVAPLQIAHRR